MNYNAIQNEITRLLRLDSADIIERIRVFLPRAIEKFLDLRNWDYCCFTETITVDGSGSYNLVSLFTNYFYRIESVYQEPVNPSLVSSDLLSPPWTQVSLEEYNRAGDKSRIYAIDKGIMYVNGSDITLKVFVVSPGVKSEYPMSDDSHEPNVIKYYYSIIAQWVTADVLYWIGDIDGYKLAKNDLNELLVSGKRKEARGAKRNKLIRISSHNRH